MGDYYTNLSWASIGPFFMIIHQQIINHNLRVWDDGATYELGTKYRAGYNLFSSYPKGHTVCYDQTIGFAGMAISALAAKFGLKARIFCRATKTGFHQHQYACLAKYGATLDVRRIASKVHMLKLMKDWCQDKDASIIPFGLNHPEVSRSIYLAALQASAYHSFVPEVVVTAAGTGTLNLALQKAFPTAKFYAVAVSRKIDSCGMATVVNHKLAFEKEVPVRNIPFRTVANYDAKAWDLALELSKRNRDVLFWNVAREVYPVAIPQLDTWVDWGESLVYRAQPRQIVTDQLGESNWVVSV